MNATTVASRTYDIPINEAAKLCGYSSRRFRQKAIDGEIFGMKDKSGQWLFSREDLDALVALTPANADARHDKLIDELLSIAPDLSPAKKARLSAALHGSAVA